MGRRLVSAAALAAFAVVVPSASRAQTHLYNLNGTYNDFFGGPSLGQDGGAFGTSGGASGYVFGANLGLSLENVFTSGVSDPYTIVIRSFFDDATPTWEKIVDFKNGAEDNGYYNQSKHSDFFNFAGSAGTPYASGIFAVTTLTRDATGLFTAYVDGVEQIQFNDTGNHGVFSATNSIARFFEDDAATVKEAGSGFVDYIATYDRALTSDEVAALAIDQNPVVGTPEPASIALLATGLIGLGGWARRKKAALARQA